MRAAALRNVALHAAGTLLLAGWSASAAPGERRFEFLLLGGGPRLAGLGGGAGRLTGSLEESFANPAALGLIGRGEAWSAYGRFPGEVSLSELGAGAPVPGWGTLAASLGRLDHEPIPAYDAFDGAGGTVRASDSLAMIGWGRTAGRFLSVGVNAKWAREVLGDVVDDVRAVDVGVGGTAPGIPGFSFGASARNLGLSGSGSLPSDVSAGVAHRSGGDALVLSVDARRRAGSRSTELCLGAEYWLKNVLAVRGGYGTVRRGGGDGASFGLGFRLSGRSRMDYSFSPLGDLGAVHRFSLAWTFAGGRAAAMHGEGVRRMREGDFAEAVLLFDQVLTLQPDHPTAARLLKECGEKIRERARSVP